MTLISSVCQAYVNHGRWIAECPEQNCHNALKLHGGETTFLCRTDLGGCGKESMIAWPFDAEGIWVALNQRPMPATRNWFPVGHKMAERFNLPAGQTPSELLAEQKMMEELGQ